MLHKLWELNSYTTAPLLESFHPLRLRELFIFSGARYSFYHHFKPSIFFKTQGALFQVSNVFQLLCFSVVILSARDTVTDSRSY